jgi:hypothetical protein
MNWQASILWTYPSLHNLCNRPVLILFFPVVFLRLGRVLVLRCSRTWIGHFSSLGFLSFLFLEYLLCRVIVADWIYKLDLQIKVPLLCFKVHGCVYVSICISLFTTTVLYLTTCAEGGSAVRGSTARCPNISSNAEPCMQSCHKSHVFQ